MNELGKAELSYRVGSLAWQVGWAPLGGVVKVLKAPVDGLMFVVRHLLSQRVIPANNKKISRLYLGKNRAHVEQVVEQVLGWQKSHPGYSVKFSRFLDAPMHTSIDGTIFVSADMSVDCVEFFLDREVAHIEKCDGLKKTVVRVAVLGGLVGCAVGAVVVPHLLLAFVGLFCAVAVVGHFLERFVEQRLEMAADVEAAKSSSISVAQEGVHYFYSFPKYGVFRLWHTLASVASSNRSRRSIFKSIMLAGNDYAHFAKHPIHGDIAQRLDAVNRFYEKHHWTAFQWNKGVNAVKSAGFSALLELSYAAGAFARWVRPSHSHRHTLRNAQLVAAAVVCLK